MHHLLIARNLLLLVILIDVVGPVDEREHFKVREGEHQEISQEREHDERQIALEEIVELVAIVVDSPDFEALT